MEGNIVLQYPLRFLDNESSIKKEDLDKIIPLSKMDSLLFCDNYFSDTIKHATLIGRSYGEPIMSLIFDESELEECDLKKLLKSMYSDDTEIYFFWNIYSSVKTNWGLLEKYWDNFSYYGDDSIIYVNQNDVYLYTDMTLKKINQFDIISSISSNNNLYDLGDETERRKLALENLFKGFSENNQDELYLIFHSISEGLRTLECKNSLSEDYIEYYKSITRSLLIDISIICKPYNTNCLNDLTDLLERSAVFMNQDIDKFYNSLIKDHGLKR